MTKIQRETIADRVVATLRRRILGGEIRPGMAITEDAMGVELGVSRATMRQALNTLMLEGLLTRHPTTRVLEVTMLTPEDVHDIYVARRFLELGGAEAARLATAEELNELRLAVLQLEQAVLVEKTVGAIVQADNRCHAMTVALLRSQHLSDAHALLMAKLRLAITQATVMDEAASEVMTIHKEFVDLLTAGEIEKAKANLARRLDDAEESVLTQVESRDKLTLRSGGRMQDEGTLAGDQSLATIE